MKEYQLYIDGKFCEASDGNRFESVNPATGEVWATAPAATEADVDRAVRGARRALIEGDWPAMTATQRGHLLYRLADLVADAAHHLGSVETTDSGKLAAETRAQSAYVSDYYRYYAGLADKIQGDTLPIDKPDLHVYTTREPLGVVAAIVPWNAEMFLTATKVGPALAAGNTVVLKPAEYTSLTALLFAEVVHRAGLPPGVLNIVTGDGVTGRALVDHPGIDKVAFT
ncbi:MAG: aldehyde dehydrogenase family protein, partial [Acidimicrobiales bacterium]|nr:aldehyde dehydrogenase family protein [Acidimicrobiales bacterium]